MTQQGYEGQLIAGEEKFRCKGSTRWMGKGVGGRSAWKESQNIRWLVHLLYTDWAVLEKREI